MIRAEKKQCREHSRKGAALVTVLCLTMLAGGVAAWLMGRMGVQMRVARSILNMEKAFYIAEGGAERAASYLAGGGVLPMTLTGVLGDGSYTAMIIPESTGGGTTGTLQGRININPNNSPDSAFFAELPGGRTITREDLLRDAPDYEGPATLVQLQPKGPGTQNTLYLNGSVYPIQNNQTYTFQSTNMTVRLYNDRRNPQGAAIGQWRIELQSPNANVGSSEGGMAIRRDTFFTIHSVGQSRGVRRTVTIRGLHTTSWSKYAFWYDREAMQLWIVGGERFEGPVYTRAQMRFHSSGVAQHGQARFFDRLLHVPANYTVSDNSVRPIFDRGITLNAPQQTMVSVDLGQLRGEASYTFTGQTYITISSNRLFVTNSRRGWTDHAIPVPDDGLIFVANATTGDSSTRPGDVYVGAPEGLAGRLTIVADRDLYVTNHVRYARNPLVVTNSTDALGLIARRNTVVATNAPNDLEIFAHIISKDGSFGVASYDSSSLGPRGTLTVYGGIVNWIRNAVGTFSGNGISTGYRKNYIYDHRFRNQPPPRYPAVPGEFQWLGWEG